MPEAVACRENGADAGFLSGGGEMGARMRALDWSKTRLGPVESWPQSLRTAVSICLSSRYPMFIWWGPELVNLYNDAYRPILGATKHPQWLGGPANECWHDVWPVVGPLVDEVYETGTATWSEDLLLIMDRNGYPEEAYFTFSYSPIRDETGSIGGIFCAVTENTERVLGERRLRTLRELTGEGTTPEAACRLAANVLEGNARDVSFALFYLLDGDAQTARLVAP